MATSSTANQNGTSQSHVHNSGKQNPKKRTHEEAFPSSFSAEPTIDEVLAQLKQRVLMGESLNNFKKEISQLVELIDKKDPQFEKLAEQVGIKLASLLQKPQQEMIFMLKRTNMLGKKNKQKQELEKASTMIKQQIELQLKQSNKKSDNDYIDLSEL